MVFHFLWWLLNLWGKGDWLWENYTYFIYSIIYFISVSWYFSFVFVMSVCVFFFLLLLNVWLFFFSVGGMCMCLWCAQRWARERRTIDGACGFSHSLQWEFLWKFVFNILIMIWSSLAWTISISLLKWSVLIENLFIEFS